ncbi:MAG: Gfo/Idh/MocA family oxidoreductase [Nitrospinae bacterium]|nr:Gfo/Idh/MocA family oxidoreductase [Nitrospinota bacterium]
MAAMPNVNLVGGADINPRALQAFQEKYRAKSYSSIEELCDDPDIDTVWIATPNTFHGPHVILAAERGKHVIVEKPMAISLAEAEQMIDAAEKHGVQFLCGGSRSSSAVVRKMREVVVSGELGRLQAMVTWSATDWMLRPRRPDELEVSQGGGVAYRQAPHQVDSVRLLAGGRVRSVRGVTGQWMAPRHTAPGFFSALLEFENGAFATLVYCAYGYFMAAELFEPGAAGSHAPGLEGRIEARKHIITGTRDEAAAKEQRTLGALRSGQAAGAAGSRAAGFLSDLGLLVVSCDHGEMRQSPAGIYIYGDAGTTEVPLTETRGAYSPELDELYDVLVYGKPVLHGGRWGLATLEVCLAIMQSAMEHRDIPLKHQIAVPDGA